MTWKFVWVKGFLSFLPSYFPITWPMNDSAATVFVANSHSFFIAALSWKPSPVPNHPAGSRLDFHHWWMKCHAGSFFWLAQMHKFINCGCGTDGVSCFLWWQFHTWLTVENGSWVSTCYIASHVNIIQEVSTNKQKYTIILHLFIYELQHRRQMSASPIDPAWSHALSVCWVSLISGHSCSLNGQIPNNKSAQIKKYSVGNRDDGWSSEPKQTLWNCLDHT